MCTYFIGFDFTLMVVGESGLGKSTLINSLFLGELYQSRVVPSVSDRLERTTQIEKKTMEIEEKGVRLRLTIIDTPGFGDNINCEDSWKTCISYIDEQVFNSLVQLLFHFDSNFMLFSFFQFRQYFQDESGLNRRNIIDNRGKVTRSGRRKAFLELNFEKVFFAFFE